jgi:hypothetical protein
MIRVDKKEIRSIDELPPYLTGADVAAFLNISRAAGYNLLNRKEFEVIRIQTSLRVQKEVFLKWIEENTV